MTLMQRAEDIGLEIKTRLERCTTVDGAETDAGRVVYLGKQAISDDLIPCTVVIEGDDVVKGTNASGQALIEQRYAVLAYVPCDPDHPNAAAHAAIRDTKRALLRTEGRPDARWGGRVRKVEYLGRDIGGRADGAPFVLAITEFAVEYVEDTANP